MKTQKNAMKHCQEHAEPTGEQYYLNRKAMLINQKPEQVSSRRRKQRMLRRHKPKSPVLLSTW